MVIDRIISDHFLTLYCRRDLTLYCRRDLTLYCPRDLTLYCRRDLTLYCRRVFRSPFKVFSLNIFLWYLFCWLSFRYSKEDHFRKFSSSPFLMSHWVPEVPEASEITEDGKSYARNIGQFYYMYTTQPTAYFLQFDPNPTRPDPTRPNSTRPDQTHHLLLCIWDRIAL